MVRLFSRIWNSLILAGNKHPDFKVAGFYFIVSAFLGWELFSPGRSLFRWDTLLYNWPIILEIREQIMAGHWPFWASSFCCGTPLLANISTGVLYPLRIVNWFLPLKMGYHLYLFLHLWLALWGMHLFLRKGMRVGSLAAFAGALAYGASGYARSMWDTHNFMAMPWIPLGFLCLSYGRQSCLRWRAAAGTGFCWAMLILGGDTQAPGLWLLAAILLLLFLPDRRALAATLALALPLGLLLAAPQWIPTMTTAMESYRAEGLVLARALERSLNPLRLLEFAVPQAFGIRDSWFGAALAGEGALTVLPWTTSIHMGQILLIPAALALVRRTRRSGWARWGLLLFASFLVLSFGRFLPGFSMLAQLPFFRSFRFPEKYLLWSNFGFAVLAAQGIGGMAAIWTHPRLAILRVKAIVWWAMALAGGCLLLSFLLPQLASGKDGVQRWLAGRWIAVAIVIGSAAAAAAIGQSRSLRKLILGVLIALNLFMPWFLELPTTSLPIATEPPIIAKTILAQKDHAGRFFRDRAAQGVPTPPEPPNLRLTESATLIQQAMLDLNSPRLWDLATADGFSPLESSAMRNFRNSIAAAVKTTAADTAALASFCRQAAVRWLLTSSERASALEAQGLTASKIGEWGPGGETVLLRFDKVVEAEIVARAAGANADRGDPAEVLQLRRNHPGAIALDLKPGTAQRLSVKETYAAGWQAFDEGNRPLTVRASPAGFIEVEAPAGTVQVNLHYTPKGWTVGCWLGFAGLILLLAALVFTSPAWRRERSRSDAV